MNLKTALDILEIDVNDINNMSKDSIKKIWKKQIRNVHPDLAINKEQEEKFHELSININEAYNLVTDYIENGKSLYSNNETSVMKKRNMGEQWYDEYQAKKKKIYNISIDELIQLLNDGYIVCKLTGDRITKHYLVEHLVYINIQYKIKDDSGERVYSEKVVYNRQRIFEIDIENNELSFEIDVYNNNYKLDFNDRTDCIMKYTIKLENSVEIVIKVAYKEYDKDSEV